MTRNHEEHNMQVEVFRHARRLFPILERLMFAVPNARKCSARERAWLKKEGLTAGVHDIIILVPRCGYPYLTIEMKLPVYEHRRNGGLSDAQLSFYNAVFSEGGMARTCHHVKDALDLIRGYMNEEID